MATKTTDCPDCGEYVTHESGLGQIEKRQNDLDLDETYYKCPDCGAYNTYDEL